MVFIRMLLPLCRIVNSEEDKKLITNAVLASYHSVQIISVSRDVSILLNIFKDILVSYIDIP